MNIFFALKGSKLFIIIGNKLYRQIFGIQMGTNCAPFVADLFLFCNERDFMTSLSDDNQARTYLLFTNTISFIMSHNCTFGLL